MLSFYAATAGREAASSLAFELAGAPGPEGPFESISVSPLVGVSATGLLTQVAGLAVQQVGQLLSFSGSVQDLVATLLTVSVVPGPSAEDSSGGTVAVPTAGIQPSTVAGVGQGLGAARPEAGYGGDQPEQKAEGPEGSQSQPALKELPPWERLASGLERVWKQVREELLEREGQLEVAQDRPRSDPGAGNPAPCNSIEITPGVRNDVRTRPETRSSPPAASSVFPVPTDRSASPSGANDVIDAALEELASEGSVRLTHQLSSRSRTGGLHPPYGITEVAVTAVAIASTLGADRLRRSLKRSLASRSV